MTELLASWVRSVRPGATVAAVAPLRGGSKKGVYRVVLGDGSTVVAYVWSPQHDHWSHATTDGAVDLDGPFGHASGLDLLVANHRTLTDLGVAVPELVAVEPRVPGVGDVALLEDLRGGSLEALLHVDPPAAVAALADLRRTLQVMHAHRSPTYGRVRDVAAGRVTAEQPPAPDVAVGRAGTHLAFAAQRVPAIADAADAIGELLGVLHRTAPAGADHGLIHSELGPDHVLLDDDGRPVLIDIEGLMFFDVEWEHAFLELRFGEHHRRLATDELDEGRLRLYRLCLHLSLVAGPLRLLDGDFPDREPMLRIVEANVGRVLAALA